MHPKKYWARLQDKNVLQSRAENTHENNQTITMGELCNQSLCDAEDRDIFDALKETINKTYQPDWETWTVYDVKFEDLFGEQISPDLEKKLIFCLSSEAFLSAIKGRLPEEKWRLFVKKPSRALSAFKRKILQWPLGRALICKPRNLMTKIHADSKFQSYSHLAELEPNGYSADMNYQRRKRHTDYSEIIPADAEIFSARRKKVKKCQTPKQRLTDHVEAETLSYEPAETPSTSAETFAAPSEASTSGSTPRNQVTAMQEVAKPQNIKTITLRDLCNQSLCDAEDRDIFKALVKTIKKTYPPGWKNWTVYDVKFEDLFGEQISPDLEKKLTFCLHPVFFFREIKGRLPEEQWRPFIGKPWCAVDAFKRKILQWPLGRALISKPIHLMKRIHAGAVFKTIVDLDTVYVNIFSEKRRKGQATNNYCLDNNKEIVSASDYCYWTPKNRQTTMRKVEKSQAVLSEDKNCQRRKRQATNTNNSDIIPADSETMPAPSKMGEKRVKKCQTPKKQLNNNLEAETPSTSSNSAVSPEAIFPGVVSEIGSSTPRKIVKKPQTPEAKRLSNNLEAETPSSSSNCAVSPEATTPGVVSECGGLTPRDRETAIGNVAKPHMGKFLDCLATVHPEHMGKLLDVFEKQQTDHPEHIGKLLDIFEKQQAEHPEHMGKLLDVCEKQQSDHPEHMGKLLDVFEKQQTDHPEHMGKLLDVFEKQQTDHPEHMGKLLDVFEKQQTDFPGGMGKLLDVLKITQI